MNEQYIEWKNNLLKLEKDWDSYGAEPFETELFDNLEYLMLELDYKFDNKISVCGSNELEFKYNGWVVNVCDDNEDCFIYNKKTKKYINDNLEMLIKWLRGE